MIGVTFWAAVGFVAYVYAGYPLIVMALSRLRRRSFPPGHLPRLSLVIAAYNEERVIATKIEDSLALDYPTELLQIVVAADGSTDRTADIAASYTGVTVVHGAPRGGKMAAIERAVGFASGEIIVLSDANNRFGDRALKELAARFANAQVGIVTGRKVVGDEDGLGFSENLYWRYEAHIKRAEDRLGCCMGVNGEILAVRRALIAKPPPWVINDDTFLARHAMRLGHRVAYAHEATSWERVSADADAERQRRSRMVAGQWGWLIRPHLLPWRRPLWVWMLVSHKYLRPLVPLASLGALVAAAASLFWPGSSGVGDLAAPWNVLAFGSQIAFYGLALAAPRLTGALGKLAYIPRFLVDSNRAAIAGFVRYARGSQSRAWDRVARRDGHSVPTP